MPAIALRIINVILITNLLLSTPTQVRAVSLAVWAIAMGLFPAHPCASTKKHYNHTASTAITNDPFCQRPSSHPAYHR